MTSAQVRNAERSRSARNAESRGESEKRRQTAIFLLIIRAP